MERRGGSIPCAAGLEDFAHRTDAGRYLNGTIDVAHVGVGGEKGKGLRGQEEGGQEKEERTKVD